MRFGLGAMVAVAAFGVLPGMAEAQFPALVASRLPAVYTAQPPPPVPATLYGQSKLQCNGVPAEPAPLPAPAAPRRDGFVQIQTWQDVTINGNRLWHLMNTSSPTVLWLRDREGTEPNSLGCESRQYVVKLGWLARPAGVVVPTAATSDGSVGVFSVNNGGVNTLMSVIGWRILRSAEYMLRVTVTGTGKGLGHRASTSAGASSWSTPLAESCTSASGRSATRSSTPVCARPSTSRPRGGLPRFAATSCARTVRSSGRCWTRASSKPAVTTSSGMAPDRPVHLFPTGRTGSSRRGWPTLSKQPPCRCGASPSISPLRCWALPPGSWRHRRRWRSRSLTRRRASRAAR